MAGVGVGGRQPVRAPPAPAVAAHRPSGRASPSSPSCKSLSSDARRLPGGAGGAHPGRARFRVGHVDGRAGHAKDGQASEQPPHRTAARDQVELIQRGLGVDRAVVPDAAWREQGSGWCCSGGAVARARWHRTSGRRAGSASPAPRQRRRRALQAIVLTARPARPGAGSGAMAAPWVHRLLLALPLFAEPALRAALGWPGP